MGLDVYLHKCKDRAAAQARETAAQEIVSAEWRALGEYNALTQEQKDAMRVRAKAIYAEHQLDEWGDAPEDQSVELASTLYPDHMFKIGYMRSSYNSAGTNHVLRDVGLPDLYQLFGAENGTNDAPDWAATKVRLTDAIDELNRQMDDPFSSFECIEVSGYRREDSVATSTPDALRRFREKWEQHQGDDVRAMGRSFMNAEGSFFMDGKPVYAVLMGAQTGFGGPLPCAYVITKSPDDAEHPLLWYRQALEIAREMCDYVMAQPDRDDYYLHWSG
jgi:hypothetical protein